VLVHLGVEGALPQLAHHSLFFTDDWDRNFGAIFDAPSRIPEPASAYVCRPSATDPDAAPAGSENLFVLVPVPADPTIGRGGMDGGGDPQVEKVADAAIAQIAAWSGIPDLSERIVVRRTVGPQDFAVDLNAWSGGALGPGHVLRQSAIFRAGNASKKVAGLFYAGSSTIPGIGLPMCLISAELVLKRLRGDRTAGPLPEPDDR
jgi:phytoene desaturase